MQVEQSGLIIFNGIFTESDAAAIKGQMEYAINKKKRASTNRPKKKRQKVENTSCTGVLADDSFIGVDLNARGTIERIFLDD